MKRQIARIAMFASLALAIGPAAFATHPPESTAEQPMALVELFQAMEDGDIEVRFIPKDATEATVLIKNKTGKPLTIKLPEAFAGVPVQAQMDMGMGMGGGMGGGMQGMGGGMGGMGGGMGGGMMGGGMGMGGGFFNVAPEKVGKLKVPTVCLEHGKKDPNPRAAYKIVPLESFSDQPEVFEVCRMLGYGKLHQNVAQAATWHLTDGMSWQELAAKNRVRLSNGYTKKWFSPQELGVAVQVAAIASQKAKQRPTEPSPGDLSQTSLGQR